MAAGLVVGLFGGLAIQRDGRAVTAFRSRKAAALLAYLAATGRPQSRAGLAGLLWEALPEAAARANLRNVLANLGGLVGEALAIERATVALLPGRARVDVALFEALLRPPGGAAAPETAALEAAVALYTGDLLAGFSVIDAPAFDEWLLGERARLHGLMLTALSTLATRRRLAGETAAAIAVTRQLLTLEPWQEEAHRLLMELLAGAGRRAEALAQYERCRALLARELGVEPDAATAALAAQIARGAWQPPAPPVPTARPVPPAAPAPAPRAPLSPAHTEFVGREDELGRIAASLAEPGCRLLTLIGPGGVGKTRLALRVADLVRERYADGVSVVSLASVNAPAAVAPAVAGALGLRLTGGDPEAQLLQALRAHHRLLVLDNMEHLLDSVPLLLAILDTAPGVTILATSRERLAVQAEWLVRLDGLTLPADDGEVASSGAVRLFVARARQARADFVLTPAVAPAVARLCRLVDGLPLGIELAAAWVRTHEVTTILRQMEHGLDFLTTRLRDVPTRHRSLRSVVAESWDRLDPPAGAALAALSVFRDPFTSESAAAVAGTTPLDLSDLADRSLLQPTDSGQFALHGVIRQYASERLSADAGAAEEARARHAAYFTARTAALVAALRGVDQAAALRTLEAEIDDSRAAWEWAVEGRRWDLVASALDGLSLFFEMRGRLQEGEAAVARAATGLSAAIGDDAGAWSLLLGRLLGWQGRFTYFTGRYEPSADLFARGATLLRTLGAHRELAFILHMQSRLAEAQGDCTAAERLNREELASLRTANDLYGMSLALNHLGGLIFNRGDFIQARHFWQESVAVRRQIGDYHGVAHDLSNMGEAAVHLGDYDEARRRSEESLAVLREHGGGWRIIHALNTLGMVAWSQGQYDEARRLHDQCLIILNEIGDRRRAAEVLINLTHVERQCGDGAAAAARAAAALTIFREIGYRRGQAYCLASNGRLALDAGRHADARQHYGESLRLARLVDDQLAIGLAGAGLGAAWHGLGDDAAAWEQTTAGLRQLLDIGALPEALEVVVELAGAPEGTDDRAEWAVAVLTFAARHPCVRHHTREEAEHQVSRLASQIPVGVLAAARRRGEAMSIEAMWLTIVAAVDARRRPVALDR